MAWLAFMGLLVVVLSTATIVLIIRDGLGPQRPPGSHFADPTFGSAAATGGRSLLPMDADVFAPRDRAGPVVGLVDRRTVVAPVW